MNRFILCVVIILSATTGVRADDRKGGVGESKDKALILGERMYRDGILPSGESMEAFVQGDVPLDGTQVTCLSCHRRSGMGTVEGTVITPEMTYDKLYQPRTKGDRKRPAYTDETLATSIREGVDSQGNSFGDYMPVYPLSNADMALLIAYMKTLSRQLSPGVTDTAIHFATVITEEVSDQDRRSMLDVLETFIEGRNALWRNEAKRARHGPYFRQMFDSPYRKIMLHTWTLRGSPETWGRQLEGFYRDQKVFGMISGISTKSWRPIHEFSEAFQVPCLLPNTDLPALAKNDFYTLYFSKGLTLEAKAVAKYLRDQNGVYRERGIVQVFRDRERNSVPAEAFRKEWESLDLGPVRNRVLKEDHKSSEDFWRNMAEESKSGVVLVWLEAEDLAGIQVLSDDPNRPDRVFLSSTLLGQHFSPPAEVRKFVYLIHPYNLPKDFRKRFTRVSSWLKSKERKVSNERIQSQTFLACMMLGQGLMHIKYDFYRDYFLEKLEHIKDPQARIAVYPHLSFGPGQRYSSKGAYIAQFADGPEYDLVDRSSWIIP